MDCGRRELGKVWGGTSGHIVYLLLVTVLRRPLSLYFFWPLQNETRPHTRGAHRTYGGAHSQPHDNEAAIDQQQAAYTVKRGEMGDFGGGSLEHARQCLGAQWAGFPLRVNAAELAS